MRSEVDIDGVYTLSEDVVAREIEGELIIVPLVAGMADPDEGDALFTLNETGRAVWNKLDGKRTPGEIAAELSREFDDTEGRIRTDVLGLMTELARRKMIRAAGDR